MTWHTYKKHEWVITGKKCSSQPESLARKLASTGHRTWSEGWWQEREGGKGWEDVKKRDNYYRVGCRGTLFSPSSLKHGENGEIGENQCCSNSRSNTVHYGSASEHASLTFILYFQ